MDIDAIVDNTIDQMDIKLSACAGIDLDNDERDELRDVLQTILERREGLDV